MASWKISTRLLTPEDGERWQSALGECHWRNICSSWFWLELWPKSWGALKAIGLFSGDDLIGGILLTLRRRWGISVLETHPMIPYAGFWLREPQGASKSKIESLHASALDALDSFLHKNCGRAAIRFDPRFIDARALAQRGWRISVRYTYLTPLKNSESLLSSFENDARRQIDLANKNGVAVLPVADWMEFEAMARQTHQRKELNQDYPESYLEKLGPALRQDGCGELFMARAADGTPLAGAVVGWDEQRAVYIYGGSSAVASGTGAPSLLQHEILRFLDAQGHLEAYDWHGANTAEVVRFKKNFNPTLVPYLVCTKSYGLATNLGYSLHEGFKGWRRQ